MNVVKVVIWLVCIVGVVLARYSGVSTKQPGDFQRWMDSEGWPLSITVGLVVGGLLYWL